MGNVGTMLHKQRTGLALHSYNTVGEFEDK